jgi:hypothetical protein
MGVLEDAIRDHLALKRRHGAADEELRRQEAEALGAARRGGTAAPSEHDLDAEEPRERRVPEPPRVEPPPVETAAAEPAMAEPAAAEPTPPLEEPAPDEREDVPVDAVDQETVLHTPSDVESEATAPPAEPEGLELEIGPEPTAEPGAPEEKDPPADVLPPVTEDGDPVEDDAPRQQEQDPEAKPEQDRLRVERKPPADLDFD